MNGIKDFLIHFRRIHTEFAHDVIKARATFPITGVSRNTHKFHGCILAITQPFLQRGLQRIAVTAAIPEKLDNLPGLDVGNWRGQGGIIRTRNIFHLRLRAAGESNGEKRGYQRFFQHMGSII